MRMIANFSCLRGRGLVSEFCDGRRSRPELAAGGAGGPAAPAIANRPHMIHLRTLSSS